MFTPWNEIRPKKYPSPGIPVVQLWQNPCNQSYPIPLGLTLWNVCPVECEAYSSRVHPACPVAPGDGTGVGQDDRAGVESGYSSGAKPIPPGPALWNEVFPIELLSLGILATRSEQNLYRPSDPIPPGFTPWNQNSYLKHPSFECQFTQSRHNLCYRLTAIPLGTGKHIKKLKKSSAHSQS